MCHISHLSNCHDYHSGYLGGNPNNNPMCGRKVKATRELSMSTIQQRAHSLFRQWQVCRRHPHRSLCCVCRDRSRLFSGCFQRTCRSGPWPRRHHMGVGLIPTPSTYLSEPPGVPLLTSPWISSQYAELAQCFYSTVIHTCFSHVVAVPFMVLWQFLNSLFSFHYPYTIPHGKIFQGG